MTFYVIGPAGENELMLSSVLGAFYDAVALLLRHQVEKRAILENLDLVVLALDETIDNGSVNPRIFASSPFGHVLTHFMPNAESSSKPTRLRSLRASRDHDRTPLSTSPISN